MALCHRFTHSKNSAARAEHTTKAPPLTRQHQVSDTCVSPSSTADHVVTASNSTEKQQLHHHVTVHPTTSTASATASRSSGTTLASRVLSLFRSRSDPNVPSAKQPSPPRRRRLTGPPRSTSASPCSGSVGPAVGQRRGSAGSTGSKTGQRRRYQRIVRNENARPPDTLDDNPFVVRKFTQEYLTNYYADKKPSNPSEPSPSPSTSLISPGSHPILKHRSSSGGHRPLTPGCGSCASTDDESGPLLPLSPTTLSSSSTANGTTTSLSLTPTSRHAKFREVVEIVEYELRDSVTKKHNSRTQSVPLNDSDDESPEVNFFCENDSATDARDTSALASDEAGSSNRKSCSLDHEQSLARNVLSPLPSPSHRFRPPSKHRRLEELEEKDGEDAEPSKNQ